MPNTCLLVIDAQQSFTQRPFYTPHDVAPYLAAQNALISGAAARGIPVVRVFHCAGEKSPDNPFAQESGWVRPLEGLAAFAEAACFVKSRHSALVGSGLDVWLTRNGIGRLIVSGIRTEQCCETTTRHASDLGWSVDFALAATLTWDMTQPNGRTLPAADIKLRTATVLQDRFAHICSVDEALARAQ
ncbi:MAG: isochorismatase family protein [Comamonas sp.]